MKTLYDYVSSHVPPATLVGLDLLPVGTIRFDRSRDFISLELEDGRGYATLSDWWDKEAASSGCVKNASTLLECVRSGHVAQHKQNISIKVKFIENYWPLRSQSRRYPRYQP